MARRRQADRVGARDLGRFFLEGGSAAQEPRLCAADAEHAVRVLRAAPGDRLVGLDGCGGRWPLVVRAVERRVLTLEAVGPGEQDPAPGEPGAPLPAIAVAVAPPRPGRIEPMLDRLTQLGVAQVLWLRCSRTGPEERAPRQARTARVVREALKQSGRTWLPRLAEVAVEPAELAGRAAALLVGDPSAGTPLLRELRSSRARWASGGDGETAGAGPGLCLVIGPEGGFDPLEREALAVAGGRGVRIAPHVLRIETAAEAAVAGAVLVAIEGAASP
jgi:16S rRNA (uracil1498-N3)-methyltransferase